MNGELTDIVRTLTSMGSFAFSIYVAVYLLTRTTKVFEDIARILQKLDSNISQLIHDVNTLQCVKEDIKLIKYMIEKLDEGGKSNV